MRRDEFSLVVGIGASAGGLQAFRELLPALPSDSGAAWILVQHLDPNHESMLSELIASHTAMDVRDAEQGEPLRADTVYVIPPGSALAVRDGRIELSEPTLHRGIRLPVDHLFRSLAREYGSRSVGIVLSGAGGDGSSGLRDIKGAGGLTIAQEPASSGQPGMPSSAIDTGLIDLVLEIDEMPRALERFATLPPDARVDPSLEESGAAARADDDHDSRTRATGERRMRRDAAASGEGKAGAAAGKTRLAESDLIRLKALLAAQIDFDLGVYKDGTVGRRVLRRMLLSGFENVGDYIDHLRERTDEQQTLVRDLLISVTSFFRDPEAHKAMRESVVDPLIAGLADGGEVRAWVAGCATGEEAYSLGMTLLDAAAEQDKSIELQIFATDVDQEALAFARLGVYPSSIAEQVPRRRLERHFHRFDGQGFRVRSSLRDCISFAAHDLTRDPPFSRMDIVSCRNVLIYLTPDAQRHVLGILHFALRKDACLVLSTSESPGAQPDLFTTVSKSARLYRKSGVSRSLPIPRESRERKADGTRDDSAGRPAEAAPTMPSGAASDPVRRAVLDAWVPPTLVISGDGSVLFMHGELGPYLRFPEGDAPRFSLDEMLRKELATRTRGALYRCRRGGRTLSVLSSPDDGRERRVRITATPAADLGDGVVMLTFEALLDTAEAADDDRPATHRALQDDTASSDGDSLESEASPDEAVIEQLENELRATREDLRNTVEELETSNEELRSSNEESMSMNEELQSANEELEATTEELRSLNEELSTVNGQLREKVEELEQVSDDLGNFFSSARVAMVFLDDRLRIKRFTPAAADLLGIDGGDVGRHTGEIARELLQKDLERESRAVLEQLETRSRELQTHDGRWFARRVLPYYTENRRIEGVVVTLLDVSETRRATERLATRERQQRVIAQLGLDALGEVDLQQFMGRTVEQVAKTLSLDYCKILELQPGGRTLLLRAGTGWHEGLVGTGHVDAGANSQAGYTLGVAEPVIVEDLATEARFSGPDLLVDHGVVSGLSCTIRGGQVHGVIGGHTREQRRFAKEDADFLQAVANVVGSTIDHYQVRLRTRLENAVAHTLAAHADPDETLAAVQSCLCGELGAVAGETWQLANDGSEALVPRFLHTVPGERRQRIDDCLRGRDIEHADDIVARVLAKRRAVGATDLGQPPLFADDEPTCELGFRTAFAFPLRAGERLIGVMALYARERLFTDETFLRSLESIGQSIGDALVRAVQERRSARLAAITESSHDALFSHDARGLVTDWLPGAERLFGYAAEEMIGAPVDRLVPAEARDDLRRVTERVLAGERAEPFESVRLARDGRRVEVSVRSSPILDPDGHVVGVSSTDRDIGRQKDAERRLLAADRQKDEFLAMLGHELRNPLASIRTAAELLGMNADEDTETRHARTIIERQSTHMAILLDGLLDVSRIVNGKITIERHPVDFAEVCRTVLEDSAERVGVRRLALSVELPTVPVVVDADRTRLVQIVDNLLSNAIRYTPPSGAITLSLGREGERVTLRVRDDGIGIGGDLLPYVFDVFRQSHRNLDRIGGGLGLGLSLVRSLVELHGGTVEAHSEGEGRGAEFIVRLPAGEGELPRATRPVRDAHDGLDILIVEDNSDTVDVLSRVLRRLGHRVESTSDGRRGVEMAVVGMPDVVLCDLGLPDGFDGYDVVRELRRRPQTRQLSVAALSGYGRSEDKARGLEAGFDVHLTKPISIAALRRALAELVIDERSLPKGRPEWTNSGESSEA